MGELVPPLLFRPIFVNHASPLSFWGVGERADVDLLNTAYIHFTKFGLFAR